MDLKLPKSNTYEGVKGPLLLVILDGMGLYRGTKEGYPGNAIDLAKPAHLSHLLDQERIVLKLKAHGKGPCRPG